MSMIVRQTNLFGQLFRPRILSVSNGGELIHFLPQVVLQVCDASKLRYLLHSLPLYKFCLSNFSELLVSDFLFPLL